MVEGEESENRRGVALHCHSVGVSVNGDLPVSLMLPPPPLRAPRLFFFFFCPAAAAAKTITLRTLFVGGVGLRPETIFRLSGGWESRCWSAGGGEGPLCRLVGGSDAVLCSVMTGSPGGARQLCVPSRPGASVDRALSALCPSMLSGSLYCFLFARAEELSFPSAQTGPKPPNRGCGNEGVRIFTLRQRGERDKRR